MRSSVRLEWCSTGMQSRTLSWKSCSSALTSNNLSCIPCILAPCSQVLRGLCPHTNTDRQHAVSGQCCFWSETCLAHQPHLSAPAVLPSISLKVFVPAAPSAKIPVVIVGAGPTGLTLSILLGKLGVPNLVLDATKALPNHPQVMQYDD